jgi:hypothetical protein
MISRRALFFAALLLTALALALGAWRWHAWYEEARQLVFSVPPGTAARLAAGEELEVLPRTIELRLGGQDTLVIRNDDSAPVQIGPYRVEPGQRFVQRYRSAGTFDLICSLHGGARMRVVVRR